MYSPTSVVVHWFCSLRVVKFLDLSTYFLIRTLIYVVFRKKKSNYSRVCVIFRKVFTLRNLLTYLQATSAIYLFYLFIRSPNIIIIIIHSFRRAQCQTSEQLWTIIRIWGARSQVANRDWWKDKFSDFVWMNQRMEIAWHEEATNSRSQEQQPSVL